MFASVVDYNTEGTNDSDLLKTMNQIIGDFDKVRLLICTIIKLVHLMKSFNTAFKSTRRAENRKN